jgi:hypothetical protein
MHKGHENKSVLFQYQLFVEWDIKFHQNLLSPLILVGTKIAYSEKQKAGQTCAIRIMN